MNSFINKRLSNLKTVRIVALAIILSITPFFNLSEAHAAQIATRTVTLSNSAASATGVTYSLATSALPTTATPVKSVQIQLCTTPSGACTPALGFSASSSTLASQPTGLGAASGWTVNAATASSLRILNASNATNPSGAVAIVWNGAVNPSATNTTFYGVITTYSDSAWTTALDTGSVALSTATQIQVALSVGEALTFCAGTSITGQNCGTIAGSLVNLGSGSTTSTSSGTSVFAASTNGATGYSVSVSGNTLTGPSTITALASGAASSIGTKQFGLNLASNTTPAVGTAVTGTGTATAAANYGTNNTFRFGTGESVASASGPTNGNTFTVSYIANIDGLTPAGAYNTTLTYVATANF